MTTQNSSELPPWLMPPSTGNNRSFVDGIMMEPVIDRDANQTNPPITYGISAKIFLPRPAFGFKVEHDMPEGLELIETTPKATVVGEHLIWNFGRVDPGHEIKIRVKVQPTEYARLNPKELTNFLATYTQNLYFETPLLRPRLAIELDGPDEVELNQKAELVVTVANSGNWHLKDVKVQIELPELLKHVKGNVFEISLGELPPADSRRFTLETIAIGEGESTVKAIVTGSDSTTATAEHDLDIAAAAIQKANWISTNGSGSKPDIKLLANHTP